MMFNSRDENYFWLIFILEKQVLERRSVLQYFDWYFFFHLLTYVNNKTINYNWIIWILQRRMVLRLVLSMKIEILIYKGNIELLIKECVYGVVSGA